MAQTYREPTALARALAGGLRAYGAREGANWKVFTKLAKLARAVHLKNGLTSVQLGADTRFIFPLGDHFWHGVFLGRIYEPGVDRLLQRIKDVPFALIDCGANMGYWSLRASSKEYGAHKAVAIEASESNFNLLQNNAEANGGRFTAVHRAISDKSGEVLNLYGKMHFGKSLRQDWNSGARDARFEKVQTISIDDVAATYLPAHDGPIVIKLDVEGVEVPAMNGARKTLEAGAFLIYEDHEKQEACEATAHLLAMGDMEIWHLAGDNALVKVASLDGVNALKQSGFDFFAFRRGSFWSKYFSEGMH